MLEDKYHINCERTSGSWSKKYQETNNIKHWDIAPENQVFEEIFIHNKSISQLSRDTNISYYSLYNTVKNIKEQINKFYESKNWG